MKKSIWEKCREYAQSNVFRTTKFTFLANMLPVIQEEEAQLLDGREIKKVWKDFKGDDDKKYPRVVFVKIPHKKNIEQAYRKSGKDGVVKYIDDCEDQYRHILNTYFDREDTKDFVIYNSKHPMLNSLKAKKIR